MMNRVSQGLLVIGNWYATISVDTCVVYRVICKSCKATEWLVVVLIDYLTFKKLNHLCIIFDNDVNERERERHEKYSIGKKEEHDLVFLELRCFSFMLSSMPKGAIVSMNANAMGEHCRTLL